MTKKVLLTGITGFVGRNLAARLLDNGWQVSALVRSSSCITNLENSSQITFYNIETEKLIDIIEKVKPDVVIHLASLYLSQHNYQQIHDLIDSNIEYGTKLLDAMQAAGIKNLVNAGTAWQHYKNEEYNPVNLYAATKQAFEAIIKYYQEAYGFNVINLQLFDTYGKNDTRKKILALLNELRITNGELAMSGGEQLIDLVHIDDVTRAFELAAEYLLQGNSKCGTYAVSSQKPLKLKDMVAKYEKTMNCRLNIKWGARPYRHREVMLPWNKYSLLPGWQAKISFTDGIKKM